MVDVGGKRQVLEQEAGPGIQLGPAEGLRVGAQLQRCVQPHGVGGGQRKACGGALGSGADRGGGEHPGLLACQRGGDRGEIAAQHLVHRQAHVLDAAGGHHGDLRGGMFGHEREHFLQRVQRPRQCHQHQRGALQQFSAQRQVPVFAGETGQQGAGVRVDGTDPGEGVLVHPEPAHPGVQRPEDQCAVVVAQDHHPARLARPSGLGGQVKQQPVGGIDGLQVLRLHIGPAAQLLEVKTHRTSTHSVPRFVAVLAPALSLASRSANEVRTGGSSFSATRSVASRGP